MSALGPLPRPTKSACKTLRRRSITGFSVDDRVSECSRVIFLQFANFQTPSITQRNQPHDLQTPTIRRTDYTFCSSLLDRSQIQYHNPIQSLYSIQSIEISNMSSKEVFRSIIFEGDDDDDSVEAVYFYDDDASIAPTSATSISSSSVGGSLTDSPQSPYYTQKPLRSLRKSLTEALSPSRRSLHSPQTSPTKKIKSFRKSLLKRRFSRHSHSDSKSTWQEQLQLPADTTQDQAMAILLCRELENMDI